MYLDHPNQERKLVRTSLETFEKILGKERLHQYNQNNYPLENILAYFRGSKSIHRSATFDNLRGMEFNLYTAETFRNEGAIVEEEVDIGNTEIDVVAELIEDMRMNKVLLDDEVAPLVLKKGVHTFECKASSELNKKCITQIHKARGIYKNCHVLVLSDTWVPNGINKAILAMGADILRADISGREIIKRIKNIEQNIKNYNYEE